MKNFAKLTAMYFVFLMGCQKNEVVEQNAPSAVLVKIEQLVSPTTDVITLSSSKNARVAGTPYINSINGTKVASGPFKNYMQADYDGQTDFWIGGGSLGAGVITFHTNAYSMASIDITSNVTVMGKSKSIVSATPATVGFRFCQKVGTCTSISNPYQVSMCPSIFGRVYATPEWYVSKRRIEVNKIAIPRDKTYLTRTGSVNPLYVPKAHDILIWNNHQAFIESVESVTRTPVKDNKGTLIYTDVRYVYVVSEVNASQNSIISTKVTTTIRETPNQPNGYVSSSAWRSGVQSASALYYYR